MENPVDALEKNLIKLLLFTSNSTKNNNDKQKPEISHYDKMTKSEKIEFNVFNENNKKIDQIAGSKDLDNEDIKSINLEGGITLSLTGPQENVDIQENVFNEPLYPPGIKSDSKGTTSEGETEYEEEIEYEGETEYETVSEEGTEYETVSEEETEYEEGSDEEASIETKKSITKKLKVHELLMRLSYIINYILQIAKDSSEIINNLLEIHK